MPITLESRVRRMLIVNLPHDVFCRGACACTQIPVVVTAENPRTGERAGTHVWKGAPASMTWLALERKAGLPGHLLEVPDVKAAIGRGHLRLVEQTPEPAVTPAAHVSSEPPAAATSAPTTKAEAGPAPARKEAS